MSDPGFCASCGTTHPVTWDPRLDPDVLNPAPFHPAQTYEGYLARLHLFPITRGDGSPRPDSPLSRAQWDAVHGI